MNKKSILILEHNRVDYLYITLYALQRVKHIKDWDIIVSLDSENSNIISQFKILTEEFNVILFLWEKEVLNKLHSIRSLNKTFDVYDEVILIDGADLIFRTDTFDALYSIDYDNYTFVNFGGWLSHNGPIRSNFYECRGNLIRKHNWIPLEKWLCDKKYVGLINPQADDYKPLVFEESYHAFEPLVNRYTQNKLGTTYFMPKPYSLHFGVNGSSGEDMEIHNRIVSGQKKDWLENVLKEHYNKTSIHFWPKNFIYI